MSEEKSKSDIDAASVTAAPDAGKPHGYSASAVTRLTGIPFRTLDFWVRSELITPSIAQATGTGSVRLYSEEDICLLSCAWELRKAGLAFRKIFSCLKGPYSELYQKGGTWLEFDLAPGVRISLEIAQIHQTLASLKPAVGTAVTDAAESGRL